MTYRSYKPIELFDDVAGIFRCPSCKNEFQAGDVPLNGTLTTGFTFVCGKCRSQHSLATHPWKRKRVYLDQSLLSDLSKIAEAEPEVSERKKVTPSILERLHQKLHEANQRQLISIIVSEIHVLETSATPIKETQKRVWAYANRIARGAVGGDIADALEAELARIADVEFSDELTALLGSDPDALKPASPILLSNAWKLSRQTSASNRVDLDQALLGIYEKQHNETQTASSSQDCITYIGNIYCDEVKKAADSVGESILWRAKVDIALLNNQPLPPTPQSLLASGNCPFISVIFNVLSNLHKDDTKLTAIGKISDEVKLNRLSRIHSLAIRSAIEGELLWKWKCGVRKNPKRFSTEYGVSRINDISHLSIFMRLCDVVTTDNDMKNMCQVESVTAAMHPFSCKLFSTQTYDDFEHYLDELLLAHESPEQRATRLLFAGYTEKESQDRWSKEILDGVIAALKKSNSAIDRARADALRRGSQ